MGLKGGLKCELAFPSQSERQLFGSVEDFGAGFFERENPAKSQLLLSVHEFPRPAPHAVLATEFEWDSHGSLTKNAITPVLIDGSALEDDAKEFQSRGEFGRVPAGQ